MISLFLFAPNMFYNNRSAFKLVVPGMVCLNTADYLEAFYRFTSKELPEPPFLSTLDAHQNISLILFGYPTCNHFRQG
jgi:hypothetical protein